MALNLAALLLCDLAQCFVLLLFLLISVLRANLKVLLDMLICLMQALDAQRSREWPPKSLCMGGGARPAVPGWVTSEQLGLQSVPTSLHQCHLLHFEENEELEVS